LTLEQWCLLFRLASLGVLLLCHDTDTVHVRVALTDDFGLRTKMQVLHIIVFVRASLP